MSQEKLTDRLLKARQFLENVEIDDDNRIKISQVCSELNVDGLRGDIVTNRASKALAIFEGRQKTTIQDIYRVITLCLRHRLRKDPLESVDSGEKVIEVFKKVFGYYSNNT